MGFTGVIKTLLLGDGYTSTLYLIEGTLSRCSSDIFLDTKPLGKCSYKFLSTTTFCWSNMFGGEIISDPIHNLLCLWSRWKWAPCTRRIIPVCKWLGSLPFISHEWPFGRVPSSHNPILRGQKPITMVIYLRPSWDDPSNHPPPIEHQRSTVKSAVTWEAAVRR